MAHLHPLLAEKDPSLMSVTIHSHPFPSFASKIINTKQLGLMLLNLVDITYKKRSRKGKQPLYVAFAFLNTLSKKSLGESAAAAAMRTGSSFTGVSRCVEKSSEPWRHFWDASPVSAVFSQQNCLPELVTVRHLATSYMWNCYARETFIC